MFGLMMGPMSNTMNAATSLYLIAFVLAGEAHAMVVRADSRTDARRIASAAAGGALAAAIRHPDVSTCTLLTDVGTAGVVGVVVVAP